MLPTTLARAEQRMLFSLRLHRGGKAPVGLYVVWLRIYAGITTGKDGAASEK
ncbi:hypothetical protein ABW387_07990 [Snodgrassella alvi]|uniref:hypothetical protein n=1 Tax=Snodgrassella alvi TaxID=1196083 RepID=UPI003514959A